MRFAGYRFVRFFALVAVTLALLSAAALAQRTSRTDEQKRADQDADKAYQNVIKNTDRGQPAQTQDPWGAVRSSGTGNAPVHTKR